MGLSGKPFLKGEGSNNPDNTYNDFIWIKTGSLRNQSIEPEDIEGGLERVGVVKNGVCTDDVKGPGGMISGFVIGFDIGEDGKATIKCAGEDFFEKNAGLWSHNKEKDAVYRQKGTFASAIYVGSEGNANPSATVNVEGVTKIHSKHGGTSALRIVGERS